MTRKQEAERQEAIDRLRGWLKPGDTVYTVLRHVSRSGMQRVIGVIVQNDDGPRDWSGLVARAIGMRWDDRRGGVIVGGCGMDMGYHVAYMLSSALYHPRGEDGTHHSTFACIGERCPSNDHSNREKPPASGAWIHSDGGYALRHAWL